MMRTAVEASMVSAEERRIVSPAKSSLKVIARVPPRTLASKIARRKLPSPLSSRLLTTVDSSSDCASASAAEMVVSLKVIVSTP